MSNIKPKNKITVPELKDELLRMNINYNSRDKKDDLYKKYREAKKKASPKDKSPSKKASGKKASGKKASGKKASPKGKKPVESPDDFEVDDVIQGPTGDDYIVALNKAGKKFWRSCATKVAKCDEKGNRVSPGVVVEDKVDVDVDEVDEVKVEVDVDKDNVEVEVDVDEEVKVDEEVDVDDLELEYQRLNKMKAGDLKDLLKKKNPNYMDVYRSETGEKKPPVKYQMINYLLTDNFGTDRRRSPKNLPSDLYNKYQRISPRREPRRETSKAKKKDKGKEKVEEEPVIVVPKGYKYETDKILEKWGIIGDSKIIYEFFTINDATYEDIIERLNELADPNIGDVVRLEPDPECNIGSGKCGSFAICLNFNRSFNVTNDYKILSNITSSGYVKGIYITKDDSVEANKFVADFYAVNPIIVGSLSSMYKRYNESKGYKSFLSKKDELSFVFEAPKNQRTSYYHLMVPADEKAEFKTIEVTKEKIPK